MKQRHELTIEEQVGQLFMVGFDALTPNEHIITLVKEYKIGNVILFARNVDSPEQLFQLTKELQELAMKEIGVPLLISIDQEGGMVTRIKNGSTFFPGAMTLAAANNEQDAYLTGKHMGEELLHLGINMDLAPSLDVNNNPYNPVIGVRSYSDDSAIVSQFGRAFIKGLQEYVIATAKHFPGHGDTTVDSHLALPTIDIDKDRFETVELRPFKDAIADGVEAIMSAHINFPLINEEGRPSTLSYNALTTLLREELGYQGLIVTDCMQMKAIQHVYTTPVGAKMAVQAGADLICVSHSKILQMEAYNAVLEAVKNGEISISFIEQKVDRILQKKASLNAMPNSFEEVKDQIISPVHKAHALEVVKRAITHVKGQEIDRSLQTLIIASNPVATTIADEDNGNVDICLAVEQSGLKMDTRRVHIKIDKQTMNDILSIAEDYEQVIYCSYNANIHDEQIEFMNKLVEANDNTHVYAMRNPYDIVFSQTIPNAMNFYEYTPNSVEALIAYLRGDIKAEGRAPISYE